MQYWGICFHKVEKPSDHRPTTHEKVVAWDLDKYEPQWTETKKYPDLLDPNSHINLPLSLAVNYEHRPKMLFPRQYKKNSKLLILLQLLLLVPTISAPH